MDYFKQIMGTKDTKNIDKKRTTIYVSQSVYRKFKKIAQKSKYGSVSGVIEKFMAEAVNAA